MKTPGSSLKCPEKLREAISCSAQALKKFDYDIVPKVSSLSVRPKWHETALCSEIVRKAKGTVRAQLSPDLSPFFFPLASPFSAGGVSEDFILCSRRHSASSIAVTTWRSVSVPPNFFRFTGSGR